MVVLYRKVLQPAGRKLLLFLAFLFVVSCTEKALPPSHHDVEVERWVGKSKTQLIASMGTPTREATLSSGEGTLLWERKNGCYITFNTNKSGIVESGNDHCAKH
jgi:hypothetical protein